MSDFLNPDALSAFAGAAGVGAAWWASRKKVPAEVDSLIADSAETTVAAALAIAQRESERADRAEAREKETEQRLDAALARVDALQAALDAVRAELNAIRSDAHEGTPQPS